MARHKNESLEDKLIAKKNCYIIRATTFLKGTNKDKFLQDCLIKGCHEAEILRDIVDIHYAIASQLPSNIEMVELKKLLIAKIKF